MSLVGLSEDGDGRAVVFGLTCRSVNRCHCCARAKRRRDQARAFLGAIEHGGVVAMVTYTIDRHDLRYLDPANRAGRRRPRTSAMLRDRRAVVIEESLRYQQWAWNRLGTMLRRHGRARGYELAQMRGVELQADGTAHVHALVRVPDTVEFMALRAALRGDESVREQLATRGRYGDGRVGLAVRAGFGMVVDVVRARSRGDVARYVTKMGDAGLALAPETAHQVARDGAAYTVKGVTAPMPRYTRRTSYSRAWAPGWVKPTPIAGFRWQLARASEHVVRDALVRSDFVLVDPAMLRVSSGGGGDGHGTHVGAG